MSQTHQPTRPTLNVIGQLAISPDLLYPMLDAARSVDDLTALLRLDGNFVLIYCRGVEVFIVNSQYSLNNYFYAQSSERFFHADTIDAIVRQGRLDLDWNFEAVANLMALENVIDNETLIAGIRAVPMGTCQHWDGRKLVSRAHSWQEFCEPSGGSGREIADRLIDLLLEGLRTGVGDRPILTASSGLDSRVNLAGLLHLGIRPELAVMGQPGAKDAETVAAIGRVLGLRVNHIVPEARDFVDGATEIARLTNGVKPLNHWHAFVVASKAGYGSCDRVLTGNNGEHVRAVAFDYGMLAHGLDSLSRISSGRMTHSFLRKYWTRKRWLPLESREAMQCAPAFAAYYGSERQIDRFMAVMPRMSFVSQCDSFILEQRRKGFQSAGLQLFRSRFPVYSPFLNKSWVDAGWGLPLGWRLDSRWHRYTVQRLFPKLIEFPEERESTRLRLRPRPLKWMPGIKKLYRSPRVVPYIDYPTLLRRDDVLALLHDNASQLDGLMPRRLVYQLVDAQRQAGQRNRLFSVLTSIAVWRASLH